MNNEKIITKQNYKDVIADAFIEKEGRKNFREGKKNGIPYRMACCIARAALSDKESISRAELTKLVESLPNTLEVHRYITDHNADDYYWNELIKEHRQAEFEVARVEAYVMLTPTDQIIEEIKDLEKE